MADGVFGRTVPVRAGFALTLLGAIAVTAPAVAAHHTRPKPPEVGPCHIRGARVLAGNVQVEVVRGPPLPGFYGVPATKRKVYSCARHGTAHFLLAIGDVDTHTGQSIDHVTLAGPFGAFHVISGSLSTDIFDRVWVIDLATGRRVAQDVEAPTYDHVLTALVLDQAGTAAWTYSSTIDPATGNPKPNGAPPGPSAELWGASTTHAAAVLDSGTIDPASVTVSGTTVSWTNAGAPRQDDLGGP
jgi:hypothetical protein